MDNRTGRQEKLVDLWFDSNRNGTIEAITGFGKTKIALDILKRDDYNPTTVLVVVPTIYLMGQWAEEIKNSNFGKKISVTISVINTAAKSKWDVDLLIMDEIHNYAANTFYEIFNAVKCDDKLGLTATLERKDGRHNLLDMHCPILDTVTMAEARKEGYVSPYTVYNLGITLNPEEQAQYKKYTDIFNSTFARFDHDFNVAMGIYAGGGKYVAGVYCKNSKQAISVWSKKTGLDERLISGWGRQWGWAMRERKTFLYSLERKVAYVAELVNKFNVPTIVFSETTAFADAITKKLGRDKCRSYHSMLRTEVRTIDGKVKKFGKTRLQKEVMKLFEDGDIHVLSTARALDEGFNVEGIEMAIMASYTSSKRQNIQRMGRALRFIKGKKATIVNMYVRDSQEEKWLRDAQGKREPIIDVDTVDAIGGNVLSTIL